MKTLGIQATALIVLSLLVTGCGSDDDAVVDPIEARINAIFPEEPGFGTVDRAQVRSMMTVPAEEDGPFFMVNLIRHREQAEYPDGRATELSGRQADEIYGAAIFPILTEFGAEPVYVADVELGLIDDDLATWTQIGVVRYASRAKFFEMLERQDFRDAAVHKEAGVEKSLVLVADIGVDIPDALRNYDPTTAPFPATMEDPPIAIVHLIALHDIAQYEDGRETDLTGREAIALYEQGRQDQGVLGLGVRPGLWLAIEGELVGDGRQWDEFRINNFSSRAAFEEVATRESLEEAGIEHRVAAIRETYALLTDPLLTQVGYESP